MRRRSRCSSARRRVSSSTRVSAYSTAPDSITGIASSETPASRSAASSVSRYSVPLSAVNFGRTNAVEDVRRLPEPADERGDLRGLAHPDEQQRQLACDSAMQGRQRVDEVVLRSPTCSSAIASSRQTTTEVTPAAACLVMSATSAGRSAGM